MSDTKRRLYRCAVAALAAYALVGFSFLLFVSAGMDNANSDISAFAARLVESDLFIALFYAIFGFSFMQAVVMGHSRMLVSFWRPRSDSIFVKA